MWLILRQTVIINQWAPSTENRDRWLTLSCKNFWFTLSSPGSAWGIYLFVFASNLDFWKLHAACGWSFQLWSEVSSNKPSGQCYKQPAMYGKGFRQENATKGFSGRSKFWVAYWEIPLCGTACIPNQWLSWLRPLGPLENVLQIYVPPPALLQTPPFFALQK